MQLKYPQITMNKSRFQQNPKPPHEWVNIITLGATNLSEEIKINLETNIIENKEWISVPKEFINIKHWKTKGQLDLVPLPKKYFLFKFSGEDDIEKVFELELWFPWWKVLIIKKY